MPERAPRYIQLTESELTYVTPVDPTSERYPERRDFINRLESGKYNYTLVVEFGDRSRPETLQEDMIEMVIDPDLLGRERYVAIYVRDNIE